MDSKEFRQRGKEMVDYIANYMDNIEKLSVTPDVEPGSIHRSLPSSAPVEGEDFMDVLKDVDNVILPGASAPACTELEMTVVDWVAKMIGLPNEFLHKSGTGGGIIKNGASQSILTTLLAARHAAIQRLKAEFPLEEDGILLSKLVAYTSNLVNYCVEKNAVIGLVKLRKLDIDENFSLRGSTLQRAIDVCATFGTTACCSFDDIEELGEICTREGIWLHVDAAYAGGALICPEFQYLLRGIQHVDSFNINAAKLMLVNLPCALLWVKDSAAVTSALTQVTHSPPPYVKHSNTDGAVELLNWRLTFGRSFESLKLWFVIRLYGLSGLQNHIRQQVSLAKVFKELVLADDNYEIVGHVTLGLVCFRLKGENRLTERLMQLIDASGQLYLTPSRVNDRFFLRFVVCSPNTCAENVRYAWNVIVSLGRQVLSTISNGEKTRNMKDITGTNQRPHAINGRGDNVDDIASGLNSH